MIENFYLYCHEPLNNHKTMQPRLKYASRYLRKFVKTNFSTLQFSSKLGKTKNFFIVEMSEWQNSKKMVSKRNFSIFI